MQLDLTQRAATTGVLHRSYALEEWDFRDNSDTGGWTFHGTASIVDHAYPVRDQFGTYSETIRAGAFDRSLKDLSKPISLFVNHQQQAIPLSNRAAGLELKADPHLRVKAELNRNRPDVQNARYAIEDGVLREMSIGFKPVKAQDQWSKDYKTVDRNQVILREVSIVEAGANTGGTEAEMRTLDELLGNLDDYNQDDCGRAMKAFERRFADLYADEARGLLRAALWTRYNPSQNQYVWIRDFSDVEVIYELDGYPESGTYRTGYTRDGMAMNLAADAVKVVPHLTYLPEQRSDPFADRDRLDRERHERLRHSPV